jgi:CubicO group peptidase (beta-lactamase class C family)
MRRLITISIIILFIFVACDFCPTQPRGSIFEWKTSTPSEQGFDAEQLNIALNEAENRSSIYSVLVIRNGYIVTERYYRGYSENSEFNIRSVSKSYLSAMTGIAIENGIINGIHDKMLDFYPEYDHSELDPRKDDITIKHLLTMQGGIDHEHNNYSRLYGTSNWIQSAIEEPLLYNPGETHSYNTFLTHLLSGISTKTSGMSTLEFGQKYLCDPLGIIIQDWQQSPQGIYFGGNSMFFTTRDMAVLGYLYLNDGEINGVQIVPRDWVEESLKNRMPEHQEGWTWGPMENGGYGYLWWLGEIKGYEVFLAIGHGGQFVVNFPKLNMIVATNSNAYVSWETADANERSALDLIANYIVPAIQ